MIPFLVLAVGVDNIFILVQHYQRNPRHNDETIPEHMGRILAAIGPSMLLTSMSEFFCFLIGNVTQLNISIEKKLIEKKTEDHVRSLAWNHGKFECFRSVLLDAGRQHLRHVCFVVDFNQLLAPDNRFHRPAVPRV